jgi:hypothetical protein
VSQPLDSGGSKNDGIETTLPNLAKACIDVSSNVGRSEIRSEGQELCPSA